MSLEGGDVIFSPPLPQKPTQLSCKPPRELSTEPENTPATKASKIQHEGSRKKKTDRDEQKASIPQTKP